MDFFLLIKEKKGLESVVEGVFDNYLNVKESLGFPDWIFRAGCYA